MTCASLVLKLAGLACGALGLALAAAVLWPVPRAELSLQRAVSLRIEARDGTVLRELASRDEGYAAPANLDALPSHVWRAFVQAEDQRFFEHPGVDPLALARALREDLRRGRFAQGGSTLSMQLARLVRPHPRGIRAKLSEMLFALRLEPALTKREILEQYLTRVPLGNDVRGRDRDRQRHRRGIGLGRIARLVRRGTPGPHRRRAHAPPARQHAQAVCLRAGDGAPRPHRRDPALGRRVALRRLRAEELRSARARPGARPRRA